jgi:hypothetical protein
MKIIDVFISLVLEILVMSVKLLNLLLSKSFDIFHGASLNEKNKRNAINDIEFIFLLKEIINQFMVI